MQAVAVSNRCPRPAAGPSTTLRAVPLPGRAGEDGHANRVGAGLPLLFQPESGMMEQLALRLSLSERQSLHHFGRQAGHAEAGEIAETETLIIGRVSHQRHATMARLQPADRFGHQRGTHALPVPGRIHRQRPDQAPISFRADRRIGSGQMADDLSLMFGHQRQGQRLILPQSIDNGGLRSRGLGQQFHRIGNDAADCGCIAGFFIADMHGVRPLSMRLRRAVIVNAAPQVTSSHGRFGTQNLLRWRLPPQSRPDGSRRGAGRGRASV